LEVLMKMLKSTLAVVTAAAVLGVTGFAQAGATLDAVQKKGFVQCGVSDGLPGFSVPDAKARSSGSTPTFAAPWPPPCSATPTRSSSAS
jgi:general L-amino acid transport system substrate-binding protein